MVQTKGMFRNHGKVENIYKRRYPGFDPITYTFSENSNIWRESLLEVITQNVPGWCQQTFCFAFTPQANFYAHILNFHWRLRLWDQMQAIFLNIFSFNGYLTQGDSLMAASSFLIYALKLLLLANATLKQNAKIRGLDGIRHTGHGNWPKFPNFAPKWRVLFSW